MSSADHLAPNGLGDEEMAGMSMRESSPSTLLEPLLEENRETYGVLLGQSNFHDRRLTVSSPMRLTSTDFEYFEEEKLDDIMEMESGDGGLSVIEIAMANVERNIVDSLGDISEIRDLAAQGWQTASDYLEKLSPTKFRGWQTRWFYLWEGDLDYYKDNICTPKGTISLYDVESVTFAETDGQSHDSSVATSDGQCTLDLTVKETASMFPNRVYKLKAGSVSMARQWYLKLNCNLLLCRSESESESIPRATSRDDMESRLPFTLRPRRMPSGTDSLGVGEPRFKTTALSISTQGKSGDIILFRAHNAAGSMVRRYTGGNYDHIGLVFRFKGDEVGLLESLGSTGVSIFLWKNFLKEKWYEQYPRMVIRRLVCPDKKKRKKMLAAFSSFVKTVVNRDYSWNPIKIIRRNSDLPLDDPQRRFFCSELVAKALKEAHLLRANLSSTAYYPSTFEESSNLKLLGGCSYGPEELIVFDNPKNM